MFVAVFVLGFGWVESRLEKVHLASAQKFQFGKEVKHKLEFELDLLIGSGLLSLLESELVCLFWFEWELGLGVGLECVWVLEQVCEWVLGYGCVMEL